MEGHPPIVWKGVGKWSGYEGGRRQSLESGRSRSFGCYATPCWIPTNRHTPTDSPWQPPPRFPSHRLPSHRQGPATRRTSFCLKLHRTSSCPAPTRLQGNRTIITGLDGTSPPPGPPHSVDRPKAALLAGSELHQRLLVLLIPRQDRHGLGQLLQHHVPQHPRQGGVVQSPH